MQAGAKHYLITGIPLPGKEMDKLILHKSWAKDASQSNLLAYIKGNDPLLRQITVLDNVERWSLTDSKIDWLEKSSLIQLLRQTNQPRRSYQDIVGIHIHNFDKVQIAIVIAGEKIDMSDLQLKALGSDIQLAMDQMHSISPMLVHRPGALSNRERMVLTLTAQGKTASDIAEQLQISQRTVHAHLQNASEKMQAANKTHTVVEAMRYGQIKLL